MKRILLLLLLTGLAAGTLAQPLDVSVTMHGDKVVLDVTAQVAVPHETAWAVLTDYEHMARFVSTLKTSTVLSRHGNTLEVEQDGEARGGPLRFAFSTVRAVELIDHREIRSHLIRGDFKSYEFVTRVLAEPAGAITVVHHGEYVPVRWVPPVIGPALIERGARTQYEELIAEMKRRHASEPPAAPPR